MSTTFHALVDHDDRLLSADSHFAAINRHAGGVADGLRVPALVVLARLARRLAVPVARTVTIAEESTDGEWYVRAAPDADRSVALAATLVRKRPAGRALATAVPADVPPPAGANWTWEVDGALRVTRIAADAGIDPVAVLGGALTDVFALESAADGSLPLLAAMARGLDFDAQAATVRSTGQRVLLAGHVRHDATCGFAGFAGGTFAQAAAAAPDTVLHGDFNSRLERVLREPLTQIIAQAESIGADRRVAVDSRYRDYASDIAGAGRHLLGLVDDLVDLEAIERPGFATARERVDLADVARRAAGLLAGQATAAQVIVTPVGGGATIAAVGEYRRALQVVVNLIANAVRHSPPGGTVRVPVRRVDGRVLLTVEDEGEGIADADQARIFEKFARLDSGSANGTGLGLYIARRLAEAMDGFLTVESEVGAGARFTLSLPAAP